MLEAFVITFREGLESFLIVAISLAYLRKSKNNHLIPAVHVGIGAAIVLSVIAGYFFNKANNQALWEAILAIAAAFLVGTMTIHMWKTARRMKSDIESHLQTSAVKTGVGAYAGVFFFTLLMITREGMESALLLNALIFQMKAWELVLGCVSGLIVAGFIAASWSRYGHRINLPRFLQTTAVFLLVFVVQLLIYGFHELTEAAVLPISEAWHLATEPFGPDGFYGQLLSYMLVIVPMSWLLVAWLRERRSLVESPR